MSLRECFEILQRVSEVSSRNEKVRILSDGMSDEMKRLLVLFLDPYRVYGIRKNDFADFVGHTRELSLEEVEDVCEDLRSRRITGNAALGLVEHMTCIADHFVRDWVRRVVVKDFRIGLSADSVNKICPGLIPEFKIGLCGGFDEFEERLPDGVWYVEPKLDGLRLITEVDENGNCKFQSRSGKELFNLERIELAIKALGLKDVVLDGEAMAKNWNDSVSILHTQADHSKKDELYYNIFDMVPLGEWKEKICAEDYEWREAQLGLVLAKDLTGALRKVPTFSVRTFSDALVKLEEFLSQGFEGAISKEATEPYQYGRGDAWLKWKRLITVEVEVIDVLRGSGRNKDRVGALLCSYNGVEVNVGSGFKDEQRDLWWSNPNTIVGKVIECKCQEVTKDGSLRFPRLFRVREDREAGV